MEMAKHEESTTCTRERRTPPVVDFMHTNGFGECEPVWDGIECLLWFLSKKGLPMDIPEAPEKY